MNRTIAKPAATLVPMVRSEINDKVVLRLFIAGDLRPDCGTIAARDVGCAPLPRQQMSRREVNNWLTAAGAAIFAANQPSQERQMAPKILLTDNPLSAMDIARELAPSGFDTVIARAGSAGIQRRIGGCRIHRRPRRSEDGRCVLQVGAEAEAGAVAERRLRPRRHRGCAPRRRSGVQQRRRQCDRCGRARDAADAGGVSPADLAA